MNRVVSLLLGLNSFTILERKTLTANDRNLQYMNIKLDDEIDIEDYSLLIRYKQVDGKIFADVYSIEKENDIQIPNSILEFPQTLTIEFCYISNKNDNRITIPRKLQLNVIDTYDTVVEPDDVVVGVSVADIIKEIPKKTEEGKAEIEKSKDEAIEELKNHSDSNVEESKEQINSFTSQKQEQLDTYTKTKESELDEYTLLKQGDMDSYTITKKNNLDTYEKIKEKQIDDYVSDNSKPSLDKYVKEKNIELDSYTGEKKSELDSYEKAKEGQLDSHTNTKKEELNQHTVQKQGQLDEYTTAKEGELDSHTAQKKNELNTHEKAKEKELDSYITTVNKPELDSYTNIKKEELNSHTKTKESEVTQVTETKKQEITAHSSNELDKFNQGAKQEADKQIGRVVAEGDVQVQRVKDESGGVIPRIEKLESGKVSKSGDTMTGNIHNDNKEGIEGVMEFTRYGTLVPGKYVGAIQANWFDNVAKFGIVRGSDTDLNTRSLKFTLNSDVYDIYHTGYRDYKFSTSSKTVSGAINELNSKKADLTGSTFTGLVAVKKDTNGEAMVALNSAYGNGDIYSGGSAKGVGFKNRTSGKGLFLGDDGSAKLYAENLKTSNKEIVNAINELKNTTTDKYLVYSNDKYKSIKDFVTNKFYGAVKFDTGEKFPIKGLPASQAYGNMFVVNAGADTSMLFCAPSCYNNTLYFKSTNGGERSEGEDNWAKIWTSDNFEPSTKVDTKNIVNDLATGGTDKVLSAEQGKVLKQEIDSLTNEIEQLKQQIAEMQNK